MYYISATTYNGEKTNKTVASKELMSFYTSAFMKCEDVAAVLICDGLTGEVLFEFEK